MKIGIFGAGHMGGAMIKGWLRSKQINTNELFVKGGASGTAEALQKELGFELITADSQLDQMEIIFLAVNTNVVMPLLTEMKERLLLHQIPVVSVAAGVSLEEMQHLLGSSYPLAHAIPNTPAQINQGTTGISYSKALTPEVKEHIQIALDYLGTTIEVAESQLGIFGTLAGCGPAFVDVFMESLADGAVLHGLDRELAYEVTARMVASSANLLLETGKHPGQLKDEVTSPGGTTIKGITALEKEGFRYATINALDTIMKS
ncbi:pyrroline-5-carboxylate reductase [Vagococcus sp.]|uniref:pyrroline-5-carboxylate reductase n=1 Tax=Vagococcus sp. TaxID=1933889 RepID=UPI003F959B4E